MSVLEPSAELAAAPRVRRTLRAGLLLMGAAALMIALAIAFNDDFHWSALDAGGDKLAHVAAFAIVGLLVSLGASWKSYWSGGALLGVVAIVLEPLQPLLTQQREASLEDVGASLAGLVLGMALAATTNAIAKAAYQA